MKLRTCDLAILIVEDIFIAVGAFELYGVGLRKFQFNKFTIRIRKKSFSIWVKHITVERPYGESRRFGKCFFAAMSLYLIFFAIVLDIAPFVFLAVIDLVVGGADEFAVFEP